MIEMNKTNDRHVLVTATVKLEFQRETIKNKDFKSNPFPLHFPPLFMGTSV